MKEKSNLTKENKRKATMLLIFGALVLIVLVAGSTYAYFAAQVGNGTSANINATTGTVDDLRFEKGEDLTFEANMTNFAEGKGNVSGSTTSKAILTANNATNEAQEDYYVYVNIITNEIEYTSYKKDGLPNKVFKTKEEKEAAEDLSNYTPIPELILSIKGPDGYIVGSDDSLYKIADLKYYNNIETKKKGATEEQNETQTVEGYDITETTGLIKIELKDKSELGEGYNYSAHIETDENKHDNDVTKPPYHTTQEWEVKVTFINLDSDQNLNTNKHFDGEVILQKEEKKEGVTLANACVGKELASCIKDNYELDETIVYHNGTIKNPEDLTNINDDSMFKNGYKITDKYKADYSALYASYSDDLNQKYLIRFNCNSQEQYVGYYCEYYDSDSNTSKDYPQYYYLEYNEGKHYDTFKEALQKAINDKYVESIILDAEDYSYRYTGYEYIMAPEYKDEYNTIYNMVSYTSNYMGTGMYNIYLTWEPDVQKTKYYCSIKGYTDNILCTTDSFISAGISEGYINEKPINNYICFDELENGECNEEYLYRIIGIFPINDKKDEFEIKVVKATFATKEELGESGAYYNCGTDEWCNNESYQNNYYWNNSTNTNKWSESNLNKENLNGYFWNNYLGENNPKLKNMIANHNWIVGGCNFNKNLLDPNIERKKIYELELGKDKLKVGYQGCYDKDSSSTTKVCTQDDLEYQDEIGLMYISDYLYATSIETWNNILNTGYFDSWLYNGYDEWTITGVLNDTYSSHMIGAFKVLDFNSNTVYSSNATIRPSFYLKSGVKLASGDGSKESPYRVNL